MFIVRHFPWIWVIVWFGDVTDLSLIYSFRHILVIRDLSYSHKTIVLSFFDKHNFFNSNSQSLRLGYVIYVDRDHPWTFLVLWPQIWPISRKNNIWSGFWTKIRSYILYLSDVSGPGPDHYIPIYNLIIPLLESFKTHCTMSTTFPGNLPGTSWWFINHPKVVRAKKKVVIWLLLLRRSAPWY